MAPINRRVLLLQLAIVFLHLESSLCDETEILLKFKNSLTSTDKLGDWKKEKPPCTGDHENWVGVMCEKGNVWGLQLQDKGLAGHIDLDSLTQLKSLRTISFMNNKFEGEIPNLSKLPALKTVYLSGNHFSGEIQDSVFNGMTGLKKLHLANNQFNGKIPPVLAKMPKLTELMLENNQFKGHLPEFPKGLIKTFNVSNNQLVGAIPDGLTSITPEAFNGNKDLCGSPLKKCSISVKLSTPTIILVVILVVVALAALVVVVWILVKKNKITKEMIGSAADKAVKSATDALEKKVQAAGKEPTKKGVDQADKMERGESSAVSKAAAGANPPSSAGGAGAGAVVSSAASTASSESDSPKSKKSEGNVKITFLRTDREEFDMSDLLRASAEVLGSGVFGSTYKAALTDGHMMVVKRYKHMNNVNKQEFHEHMRRLGRLSHPNVLPLVGFYYRKEEKLLITDYVEKVSLAVHLHGSRSRGRPSPNWPTRLNIVKGVSKGLLYLNNELPSITAPHGHLKSSNVLIDANYTPLLADYALVPIVNQEHAQDHMISYKSPEYKQSGRITKKTDVWSLGVLILEILTGRFPENLLQQGKGNDTDLVTWVESVMHVDSTETEVFDKDMDRSGDCEGEMMKLLKIGLNCCDADVDSRPDIREAVQQIEKIKEVGGDSDDDDGDGDGDGDGNSEGEGDDNGNDDGDGDDNSVQSRNSNVQGHVRSTSNGSNISQYSYNNIQGHVRSSSNGSNVSQYNNNNVVQSHIRSSSNGSQYSYDGNNDVLGYARSGSNGDQLINFDDNINVEGHVRSSSNGDQYSKVQGHVRSGSNGERYNTTTNNTTTTKYGR